MNLMTRALLIRHFCLIAALLALTAAAPLWAHGDAANGADQCAHYLGNEGIMVSDGKNKILFDAFYADSYGQYALVPEVTRRALISGEAPFDGVTALFVSHVHGDHFSPEPTLAFLQAQPKVVLYASGQVIDALKAAGSVPEQQLRAFDLAVGDEAQSIEVGGLAVEVVRIPHAGGEGRKNIENLAFRVTLNEELTVLHMGDADPNDTYFAPHQAHWDARKLDTAFPPYWFYGSADGQKILKQRLKPGQTIGIHVPIAAKGNGDAWRTKHGGDLFTDPGEIRALSSGHCE